VDLSSDGWGDHHPDIMPMPGQQEQRLHLRAVRMRMCTVTTRHVLQCPPTMGSSHLIGTNGVRAQRIDEWLAQILIGPRQHLDGSDGYAEPAGEPDEPQRAADQHELNPVRTP
jgi:hypothetical protein